ncbi:MAG: hypothetical protein ABIK47_07795 [candidate division WOR-3 bacterium]
MKNFPNSGEWLRVEGGGASQLCVKSPVFPGSFYASEPIKMGLYVLPVEDEEGNRPEKEMVLPFMF